MLNSTYRLYACICALLLSAVIPFSITAEPDNEPEAPQVETEDSLEELLKEDGQNKNLPDKSLQRNFIFIQSAHPNDLNPHTASYSSEAQLLSGLYEGLFSYDPASLNPKPAVAESYRISRNKLRWTFTLRKEAAFSDGSPITAQNVKDSWLTLLKTPNAPYASLFDIVKGAKAYRTGNGKAADVGISTPDEHTVIVLLEVPGSHLARLLCHHAFSIISGKPGVTSGAFILAESSGSTLIMKKNEHYWDADSVYLPQITVIQSDDTKENSYLFNTGKADWVDGSIIVDKILNKSTVHIHAEYGTQYLFFKSVKAPWNNPQIRNALLAAVPWSDLRKGALVSAKQFVYPLSGYPEVEGLTYTDTYEAAELMKEARHNAGISEDKKLQLTFGIIDDQYMKRQADVLKKAWEPLGVELKTESLPPHQYLGAISSWDADLLSYTWIGDFADPLAFLELFRSDSTLNPSGWKNAEFDALLDSAAAANDETQHLKLLAQAEQLLLDNGEVLPISHPVSLHVINLKSVGGWYSNALDIHPFKYLYLKPDAPSVTNVVMK